MPAWRNGLARWTSNPKVVGSTPTVGAYYFILGKVEFQQVICFPQGLSYIKWENMLRPALIFS